MKRPDVSYPVLPDTPVSHLPFSPVVVVGDLVHVAVPPAWPAAPHGSCRITHGTSHDAEADGVAHAARHAHRQRASRSRA